MPRRKILVTALYQYPVKGCRGCAVEKLLFDAHGPVHDRRWILVDENRAMVTQRNTPGLARIEIRVAEDRGLRAGAEGHGRLSIPPPAPSLPREEIEVWRDAVGGRDAGKAAAAWFSEVAGKPVRLLQLAPEKERKRVWDGNDYAVGFADGYPLLVCNEASLEDLNQRLAARGSSPVPMERFRPNIVVRGEEPWEEDDWTGLSAKDGLIRCATGCARCTVTTVDQASGAIPARAEPLATLAQFRKQGDGVIFGRNALGLPPGSVLQRGEALTLVP